MYLSHLSQFIGCQTSSVMYNSVRLKGRSYNLYGQELLPKGIGLAAAVFGLRRHSSSLSTCRLHLTPLGDGRWVPYCPYRTEQILVVRKLPTLTFIPCWRMAHVTGKRSIFDRNPVSPIHTINFPYSALLVLMSTSGKLITQVVVEAPWHMESRLYQQGSLPSAATRSWIHRRS